MYDTGLMVYVTHYALQNTHHLSIERLLPSSSNPDGWHNFIVVSIDRDPTITVRRSSTSHISYCGNLEAWLE